MAKNTIVFLTLAYHPSVGGAEKQTQFLAEAWAARGQPVWVLTRRVPSAPHDEVLGGVRIIRLPSLWLPGLSWISFCAAVLSILIPKANQISCLIGIMLNPGTLPGAILSRLYGIPLILRPSAGGPGGNIQELSRSNLGRLKLSFLLGSAACVTAINQEVTDELLAAGLPFAKLKRVPNGVDLHRFTLAKNGEAAGARLELGLESNDPVALFVGRLEKVKNLDGLVQAWESVVRQLPAARLLIVGEGSERGRLESLIREKGLATSIRMEGARHDLVPYYRASDVFVLPSHREGISNALLEAMACGVVPLASRVGGSGEVLKDVSPELLIDPESPEKWPLELASLLKDKGRRKDLGRRARALVEERYSASIVEQHYQELVAGVTNPRYKKPFPHLAYHRVLPTPVYGIDMSTREFERQVAWLARKGYRGLSLAEFEKIWRRGEPWPAKSCVFTFDDGHREFYDHAVPIMKQYGFRATVFVNTGLLGKKFWVEGRRPAPVQWHEFPPAGFSSASSASRIYEFMTWDQVRELHRAGFEIGSHAVTHPFLTDLEDAELRVELQESRKTIADQLGAPVDFFCYPSGDFDSRVEAAVKQAGYRGAVYSPSHDQLYYFWDNSFAWERIGVWQDVAFWKFRALVEGWYPKAYRSTPPWLWNLLRQVYRSVARV